MTRAVVALLAIALGGATMANLRVDPALGGGGLGPWGPNAAGAGR